MTTRQQKILEIIVREYVDNPQPVTSKILAKKLGLSSATLRNEMMDLENLGYLNQPHTSAGRVPTDKAYRFFINQLNKGKVEVSVKRPKSAVALREGGHTNPETMFRDLVQTLAKMSGNLAFGAIEEMHSFFQTGLSNLFREPEFADREFFGETARIMEEFEKHFNELFANVSENETKVFIGKDNPMGKTKKISIIVSKCKMPNQKHGVIGLLGPTRMRYDYNISLINKLRELMEGYE